MRRPELLLLDDPTNNLDVANVEFLESVIAALEAAVVIVSHDDVFLDHCGMSAVLTLGTADISWRRASAVVGTGR